MNSYYPLAGAIRKIHLRFVPRGAGRGLAAAPDGRGEAGAFSQIATDFEIVRILKKPKFWPFMCLKFYDFYPSRTLKKRISKHFCIQKLPRAM